MSATAILPTSFTSTAPDQTAQTRPPRFLTAGLAPQYVDYDRGLTLQVAAAERIRSGTDRGTILILEHTPVYTAGKRSLPEEYPSDGTPVIPVDRGGKVTWHGPGQLVAYPVVRLKPQIGVVDFVRKLETMLIAVAAEFGASGFQVPGRSGVWAESQSGQPAKFAQIGLHASNGIITHGIALNCSNDLTPFANFVPCGITDAGVTTLSALSGREITPDVVTPTLTVHLAATIAEVAA